MKDGEKIIYCYNCKTHTIYSRKDFHGNSGVESHCNICGWYEWMNHAVALERERWREHFNQIILSVDDSISVR